MTPNKDLVSDHVRTLIKSIHTEDHQKKVFVIAAAVELLRRVKLLDKNGVAALVNFYSKVADVPWEKIQFSFTHAVSGRAKEVISQYAHESLDADKIMLILMKAIAVFTDVLAEMPDEATQEIFDAVVAELADNHMSLTPEIPTAPPVFHAGMIEKIFKQTPPTDELLASTKMRHVLFTGQHGVRCTGLLHENTDSNWIILDTGEVLYDIDVSRTEPEDSAKVSPLLACYFSHFMAWLTLGSLTVETDFITVNLQTLVDVFDMAREAARIGATGATGPVGAVVRFPLRDMDIVFEASADTNGPYATAKLVKGDTALMRLDRPRENTPVGVYMFPLPDRVIIVRARDNDDD